MQFPNHLYLVNLLLRRKIVISESIITIGEESINSNTGYEGGSIPFIQINQEGVLYGSFVLCTQMVYK